jgi:hypothetical protein
MKRVNRLLNNQILLGVNKDIIPDKAFEYFNKHINTNEERIISKENI